MMFLFLLGGIILVIIGIYIQGIADRPGITDPEGGYKFGEKVGCAGVISIVIFIVLLIKAIIDFF